MPRHIITIARQYLRTTYSSRMVVLFALAMPLVFTFVLGTVIRGGTDSASTLWLVAVVDEDGGMSAQSYSTLLAENEYLEVVAAERNQALTGLEDGEFVATVMFPSDFSRHLEAGLDPTIDLVVGSTDLRVVQLVEQAVRASAAEMAAITQAARTSTDIASNLGTFAAANVDEETPYLRTLQRIQTLWTEAPPIAVAAQPVTRMANADTIPDGFQQSSPGMLVTFALVFVLNGAIVLILEREQGTLRRLLVMPIRKSSILTGKLGAIFIAGLAQAAVLILAGQFLFGVNWGQAPMALVLLIVAFAFSITSLGMMIAGVARTYAQANALANIIMYSIAALGGAWWPIEITPEWMQRLAQLTPTFWAMQGFHDIISKGLGVKAITTEVLVLLLFGIAFLFVGIWRFRYE